MFPISTATVREHKGGFMSEKDMNIPLEQDSMLIIQDMMQVVNKHDCFVTIDLKDSYFHILIIWSEVPVLPFDIWLWCGQSQQQVTSKTELLLI